MFKPFQLIIVLSFILNLKQTNELHVSNQPNQSIIEIPSEETTVALNETVANISTLLSFDYNSTSESFTDQPTSLFIENTTNVTNENTLTSITNHETSTSTESTDTTFFESTWPETTSTSKTTFSTTKTTSTRDVSRYCQAGYIGKYCDGKLCFIKKKT